MLLKKKNLTTKIFNKSENPLLVKKYKIETYPALVRVRGKRHKLFKDKRNMKNILKFLILILNQIKKIDFLDKKIEKIRNGNSLYKTTYFNNKYFYRFSSKNRSNIILATTNEEINLLQN